MRVSSTLIAFLLGAAVSLQAEAHPGHGNAISTDQAAMLATTQVGRLVDDHKLESSWRMHATLRSVQNRQHGESMEYVVIFSNPAASDAERATLYVFLTETGEYVAANFSGR